MPKRLIVGIAVVTLVVGGWLARRQWIALNQIELPPVAGRDRPPLPRPHWMAVEEVRVYEAIIEDLIRRGGRGRDLIVVLNDHTAIAACDLGTLDYLRAQAMTVRDDTWNNFAGQNRSESHFSARLSLSVPSVIDGERIEADTWDDFYRKHPGAAGRQTLSRVGFNASGSQALAYVDDSYGGLGATYSFVLLEKHDGRWAVVKTTVVGMA